MDLSAEDAKLITLARAARKRNAVLHGAAVRDLDGRSYVAATVDLETLRVEALPLAVAMAVSSGATGLEAGVIVTKSPEEAIVDQRAFREVAGQSATLHIADADSDVVLVHEA